MKLIKVTIPFRFYFVAPLQPNIERKPVEEMLAAEKLGSFVPTEKECLGVAENVAEETSDVLTKRLENLEINQSTDPAVVSNPTENHTRQRSTSRPLTMDEDDLELDLELDENIDTTVGFLLFLILHIYRKFDCLFLDFSASTHLGILPR